MKNISVLFFLFIINFSFAQNDSCVNIGFEYGDFTGWQLYHGEVNINPFEMINIVYDTTATNQHLIVSGGNDPVIGSVLPRVYPGGDNFSLQLGDGTLTNYGAARIQQTLLVDSVDNAFAYHYALVLEDPGTSHTGGEMPFFTARVITQSGDTVHNNEVLPAMDASTGGDPDFVTYAAGVYLPWKTKYVDLSAYIGEYVTVEFTSGDCGQGGHYGYAYVDADCLAPNDCMFYDYHFNDVKSVECDSVGYASVVIDNGAPPYSYLWNSGETTPYINPSSQGVYNVNITDSLGCSLTKYVLVNGVEYVNNFDLNVSLTSNSFRPGQPTYLYLNVINDGCIDTSGQLTLVLDNQVSYDFASPAPDVINGDTLMWNMTTLVYDSTFFHPYVSVITNFGVNIGDVLCFDACVYPIIGDADSTNNFKHYCRNVVNSYDPNYKDVYPQGECFPNYVMSNQELTYTVHFQNTGTAPAINVHIMDTLSADLDINSIKVIGQNHQGLITEVINGNTLDFQFNNINLPDSTSNEPESHGYVVFEIKPINAIPHDTKVENKVGIYFDYNDPVITNTVFNTFVDSIPHQQTVLNEISSISYELNGIVYDSSGTYYQEMYSVDGCDSLVVLNLTITPTGLTKSYDHSQIKIYPNPVYDRLSINVPSEIKNFQIAIYNVTGNLMYKGENITTINISHFSQGVYYIKLWSGKQLIIDRIIKN